VGNERREVTAPQGAVTSAARYDFATVDVRCTAQVAWVRLQWPDGVNVPQTTHRELAACLRRLRRDDAIRVVVLRGATEHRFMSPFAGAERDGHLARPRGGVMSDPRNVFAGLSETDQILDSIVRMEKPVVAMVNGDALGNGASVAMACDVVLADQDAYITDIHLANHHFVARARRSTGVVPGDGGTAFWTRRMGLVKAKEYLFTARPVRARELAALGAINRAVPHEQLHGVVDETVAALLERPAWALAWTKAQVNKALLSDMALTLDASGPLLGLSMRVRDEFPGPKGIDTL
jgi:enoyl-CoA hydratase